MAWDRPVCEQAKPLAAMRTAVTPMWNIHVTRNEHAYLEGKIMLEVAQCMVWS
jgi:hypothetical protein